MTTQRSTIVTAVRAALSGAGGPVGLTVTPRKSMPAEALDLVAHPLTMVGRTKEQTVRATPSKTSPVVKRTLTIRLDHWVAGDDPEELLEPLLAWGTAKLAGQGWGGLAMNTSEESTDWDLEMLDQNFGHATQTFTVDFATKTTDQEKKQ